LRFKQEITNSPNAEQITKRIKICSCRGRNFTNSLRYYLTNASEDTRQKLLNIKNLN